MTDLVRRARCVAANALAAILVASGGATAAFAGNDISKAEQLLFEDEHLRGIDASTSLAYRFQRTGTMEPPFEDKAEVVVNVVAGKRNIEVRCLSGGRKVDLPALEDVNSNPVLLCFLEREIREMERMTGGKSGYFRKRIRMALAESAQVRDVAFDHAGRRVRGVDVTITPYLDDPLRSRFERLATKRYVFRLSDEVPGKVVLVRGMVPGGEVSDAALAPASELDERMEVSATR